MKYEKIEDIYYYRETMDHISKVYDILHCISRTIIDRASNHDRSKFDDEEFNSFATYTPKLKSCTYGSEEYKNYLKELGTALEHHYSNNKHHPEFANKIESFMDADGIVKERYTLRGMNLIDLIEMLADWKAATLRHDNGDIYKSLDINKIRFGISDELYEILKNTIDVIHGYNLESLKK